MKNSGINEKNEAIPNACQKGLENNCLPTSSVVAFIWSMIFYNCPIAFWMRSCLVDMGTAWSKKNIFQSIPSVLWKPFKCPRFIWCFGTKFSPHLLGLISCPYMAFKLMPPWLLDRQTSESCCKTNWLFSILWFTLIWGLQDFVSWKLVYTFQRCLLYFIQLF